jgi:hypothetical protein
MSRDPFVQLISRLFLRLGTPAVYTTQAGVSLNVRVITKAPDTVQDFGQTHLVVDTQRFELMASEVKQPRDGDRLVLGGVCYVLHGEALIDRDGLVWTVSASIWPEG